MVDDYLNNKHFKIIFFVLLVTIVMIFFIVNTQFYYVEYVMNYLHVYDKLGIDEKNTSKITTDGMSLFIQSDKKYYLEGEPIHLSWEINNIGEDVYRVWVSSVCDTGIGVYISDSNNAPLKTISVDEIKYISNKDIRHEKFHSLSSYAKILALQEKNPEQKISIRVYSTDVDALKETLKNNFNATKVNVSNSWYLPDNMVYAKIPVKNIPGITDHLFVKRIITQNDCIPPSPHTLNEKPPITFEPGGKKKGSMAWSQFIISENEDNLYDRTTSGEYTIHVKFGKIKNSLIFRIL